MNLNQLVRSPLVMEGIIDGRRQFALRAGFALYLVALLAVQTNNLPLAFGWGAGIAIAEITMVALCAGIKLGAKISTSRVCVLLGAMLILATGWALGPLVSWSFGGEVGRYSALMWLTGNIAYQGLSAHRSLPVLAASGAPHVVSLMVIVISAVGDGGWVAIFSIAMPAISLVGFVLIGVFQRRHTDLALATAQDQTIAERDIAVASTARLSFALDTARSAAWETDASAQSAAGLDELSAIYGHEITYPDLVTRDERVVHRDDKDILERFIVALRLGAREEVEYRVVRSDGTILWVRTIGQALQSGDGARQKKIIYLTTDITARKIAEIGFADAMRQAADALGAKRSLLASIEADIGVIDPTAVQPSHRHVDALQAEASSQTTTMDVLYTRLAHLLTEIDARDLALSGAIEALRTARSAAEASNVAKSQFLASMSHELRTPLNAIIGYSEILLEEFGNDSECASESADLHRIISAAQRLLHLINDILDLSKVESGSLSPELAEANIEQLVRSAAATVAPAMAQNGNSLEVQCDDHVGFAFTDAFRLEQCVLNLLANAAKFTKDGVVTLDVDRHSSGDQEHIVISVRDTGIGVSESALAKLFKPFVQADSSMTRAYGGTGLGLSLTRKIMEALGGTVAVESEPGRGSTFRLSLPVDCRTRSGCAEDDLTDLNAQTGPVVVVIDHDAMMRDLTRRALSRAGFKVQGAQTAAAGLALIAEATPSLVILDWHLPDQSGLEVLNALRASALTHDLPVLMLTLNEDRAGALAAGASEHLVKPVNRDTLAAAALRLHRQRRHDTVETPTQVSCGAETARVTTIH